jgi:hypothetical protein
VCGRPVCPTHRRPLFGVPYCVDCRGPALLGCLVPVAAALAFGGWLCWRFAF